MMTFDDVLSKYRAESSSKSSYGTKFEELMVGFLQTYQPYDGKFSEVVLWKDFEHRRQFARHDIGIDIVARTVEGNWWAVQCKMYEVGHAISKADIDSFMSASSKVFEEEPGKRVGFSNRLLIATTDNLGPNTQFTLEHQNPPVSTLTYSALRDAQVDWEVLEKHIHGKRARNPIDTLRPHQQRALEAALDYYKDHTRGKLIMACGSGKTLTALRIAEAMLDVGSVKKGCILFLAPSISLVGQSMRAWANNSKRALLPICVCSDPKASKNDIEDISSAYLELPATTDAGAIVEGYRSTDRTVVVFSTYQSIGSVAEAQVNGLPEFDLVVCDEAHRTTGVMKGADSSVFTEVHDEKKIIAKRRMYMTATPRIYKEKSDGKRGRSVTDPGDYTVYSMDNEDIYGHEFFRYSFGEAVRDGQLCDYKVLVLTIDKKDNPPGLQDILDKIDADTDEKKLQAVNDMCRAFGCLNAMAKKIEGDFSKDPVPMSSAVVFASWIQTSIDVMYEFNTICKSQIAPIPAEAKHIDGRMNAIEREKDLNWLRAATPTSPRILCNAKCLTEGVDVPALDAIMFFGSTDSEIDVIQSVGRVMRNAPGKEYGYIIIPVVVDSSLSPEEELDTNPYYKIVWKVLRALRSHDEALGPELDSIPFSHIGSKHVRVSKGYGSAPTGPDVVIGKDWDMGEYGTYIQLFTGKMVEKVGDKDYIENWAVSMAKIAPTLRAALQKACLPEEGENASFRKYLASIRSIINHDVSEKDAIDMLMQQYVTKPIFNKLFGDNGAVAHNSVFSSVNKMMSAIDLQGGLKDIEPEMDAFYESVERTLQYIDTAEGKQKTIKALYEKFFKKAFGKEQEKNGVVYTPGEIVDFILRSADDILKAEFGRSLTKEGVNILDPFTGTGTFVAHLLGSGLISKEDLERKYTKELFANEITLLAYYIATVNIENAYALAMGVDSAPSFENILLTDTFNIENLAREGSSDTQSGLGAFTGEGDGVPFGRNRTRIKRENKSKITVIVGNPPYGANQKSANDDAKKRRYAKTDDGVVSIDQRIKESYLEERYFTEKPKNLNSVYDNYIRAFRWASDRIRGDDGIILFVTPNGWLAGSAFVGFRKAIEKGFDSIYVYNLRGDQNSGDWKNEGEKVFGEGSKVGIAVTMLVHHKGHSGNAKVYYHQVENGLKRTAKLEGLIADDTFTKMKPRMTLLHPAENGDWIVQRSSVFPKLMPLAGDTSKKFENHCEETVFEGYSNGYKTNRDAWSYNFSKDSEEKDMSRMLDEYARQTAAKKIEYLGDRIKWNRSLEALSRKRTKIVYNPDLVVRSFYRPFSKRWFYNEPKTIDMTYQMPRIYPEGAENLTICVAGVGVKKSFSCLMTNTHTDLEIVGKSQCFPLYWYDVDAEKKSSQKGLEDFGIKATSNGLVRHDGISDWALQQAVSKYGNGVTKEDIFYYIYGYLHSPDYRAAFEDDLKLSLPRIGFVDSYDDFKAFSEAGRKLTDLHLNYESAPYPEGVTINGTDDIESILSGEPLLKVTKMKLDAEKGILHYNDHITVENIPSEAFGYVVNGRSALAWIVDQYQVSTDKESGIVNDPNEYAGPAYILKLVLSVITVSVETMRIVKELPKLSFEEKAS